MADEVLKLTHALVRYGTVSHPVKRRARDIVVPALAHSTAIQRRIARRLTHVGVAYPTGPLARPDSWRRGPGPDTGSPTRRSATAVRPRRYTMSCGTVGTYWSPGADLANVLNDARLRPYQNDINIVTSNATEASRTPSGGTAPVVLVRPDGHVAVRARPATLDPVIDYLHDLFGERADPCGRPYLVGSAPLMSASVGALA